MPRTPGGIPEKDWRAAQRIGRHHKVDPLLLVSIGKIETDWGRLGDGRKGNILGVGSFDSGSSYQWAGVHNQLKKGAELLQGWGVRSVGDIKRGKASAWATDPNWENAVSSMYSQLAGGKYSTVGRGRRNNSSVRGSRTIPGVDNSAVRQSLLQNYLATDYDPNALLNLASGLKGAQDVPGMTIPGQPQRQRSERGGPRLATGQPVMDVLRKASKWAKKAPTYLWGGGHGGIAKVGDDVDCSGFTSAIAPGVTTPMVASQFKSYGAPGKGRHFTVYASDSHVFTGIRDPRTGKERFFGTSNMGKNPRGGVTEFKPSASYLSGFVARHPK